MVRQLHRGEFIDGGANVVLICLAVRRYLRDLPASIRSHLTASRQMGPACLAAREH